LLFWWLSVDSTKRADSLDSYQFATTTTPANHQALISKALTMQTGPLSNIKKKQKKKKTPNIWSTNSGPVHNNIKASFENAV